VRQTPGRDSESSAWIGVAPEDISDAKAVAAENGNPAQPSNVGVVVTAEEIASVIEPE
jgi:hypothetical protein